MKEIDIFERNLNRLKKVDGNLDLDEAKLIHYLKVSKDVDGFEDRVSRYKSFLMLKAGEKMASIIIVPIIQVVFLIISGLAMVAIYKDNTNEIVQVTAEIAKLNQDAVNLAAKGYYNRAEEAAHAADVLLGRLNDLKTPWDKESLYLLPYIIGATTLIQIGLYLFFISTLVSAGRYLKEFGKCYQI